MIAPSPTTPQNARKHSGVFSGATVRAERRPGRNCASVPWSAAAAPTPGCREDRAGWSRPAGRFPFGLGRSRPARAVVVSLGHDAASPSTALISASPCCNSSFARSVGIFLICSYTASSSAGVRPPPLPRQSLGACCARHPFALQLRSTRPPAPGRSRDRSAATLVPGAS